RKGVWLGIKKKSAKFVSGRRRSVGRTSWRRMEGGLHFHIFFCPKVQLARVLWLPYSAYMVWPVSAKMRWTRLETATEEIEDTARAPWGQLVNQSPRVPIIAVVDDDESVRESLAGLAESVGYEAALFASA